MTLIASSAFDGVGNPPGENVSMSINPTRNAKRAKSCCSFDRKIHRSKIVAQ